MISVRGDAVVIEYDQPAMDAALEKDPRKPKVKISRKIKTCVCGTSFVKYILCTNKHSESVAGRNRYTHSR